MFWVIVATTPLAAEYIDGHGATGIVGEKGRETLAKALFHRANYPTPEARARPAPPVRQRPIAAAGQSVGVKPVAALMAVIWAGRGAL